MKEIAWTRGKLHVPEEKPTFEPKTTLAEAPEYTKIHG